MPESPPAFTPVQQEAAPLRRKITAALRQAIESGRLRPGERLVEKDLCQQLSVSRTSFREAIRELESEGLLTTGAGGGVAVAAMSEAEARNIYRVRGVLEGLVAEQFAEQGSPAALVALRAAASQLEFAYQSGRIDEMLVAKRVFYARLCEGAANPVAMDLLVRLNSRINLLRTTSLSAPNRLEASIAEIWDLVDALAERNAIRARQAALTHVARAAEAALG
jgi:DNA-binding GntR family transcriptional regulator